MEDMQWPEDGRCGKWRKCGEGRDGYCHHVKGGDESRGLENIKYVYGEISSESGSIITYLPIIHPRKIERASPIAVVRVGLSDFGYGDIFTSTLLSTYQVLCRGLCDTDTYHNNTPSV